MRLEEGKSISNKEVWRDLSGTIRCPGDNCPQKACDETCPIWLNTIAASSYASGEVRLALMLLEKAGKIAPDFYDAWNNMGAMFGQLGNYQEAYDSYLKAHEIKPEKNQPILGLVLSSCDLKFYEECLRWCDEYDKISSDHRCDVVRAKAKEALGEARNLLQTAPSEYSPITLCSWLLEEGKKAGFINDEKSFPQIPEIMFQANSVVLQLQSEMREIAPDEFSIITPVWATYAALGAVRFWNDDWNTLKANGILPTLTGQRGLNEMDEFVTDYIGWEFGSEKSEKFISHIRALALAAFSRINELTKDDSESAPDAFVNMLMAFFFYGMIIEMTELGMN